MKKYVAFLIVLATAEIGISLYLALWRENFYMAVTAKNMAIFSEQIVVFISVALVFCFVAGMAGYISRLTALKWTTKLSEKARAMKLPIVDNSPQRQEQDVYEYPDLFISLVFSLVRSIGYVIVFSISIASTYYIGVIAIYAIIASIITKYVAKPLIQMNYDQQNAAATFRRRLSEVNFTNLMGISLGIARKNKYLQYVQAFFSQMSVIIPLLIIAPMYFTTDMTFGQLMTLQASCSILLENLLLPMNSFATINRLISCRKRLKEIKII